MGVGEIDGDESTIEAAGHPMRWALEDAGASDPALEAQRAKVFGALFAKPTLRRFGRYIVLDALGQGGMGMVLKGYDDELDRLVAIKVLHADPVKHQGPRLKREAQALAKLSHPNVVQVYEVGEADGQLFVVMELVKGQTLQQWQKDPVSPHGWKECVEVYLQAGQGLAAAHAKGLVHRDFKPGNAIVNDDGRVRVLDFGLARQDDDNDSDPDSVPSVIVRARTDRQQAVPMDMTLTRTGAVLGTPAYMSPEQMGGAQTDPRSDQFSFCLSLYEVVYGERPFGGRTLADLMDSVTNGIVRPPPRDSAVPATLRRVLLRGLATEPKRRWPSMDELLTRLQRVVGSVEDEEVAHLRRHVDLRIGVRARVIASVVVGLCQLGCGIGAHLFARTTGEIPEYPFLFVLCCVSSLFVIGFILHGIRRRSIGPIRRPMSLMSRTQMSLMATVSVSMLAIPSFGLALALPIEAVVGLALLFFGLILGAMAAFLPRMLVPAGVFVACAMSTIVWPEQLWLWWATSGGIGIFLMGWAWHGLSRQAPPSMVGDSEARPIS